jgi:hypothetical protein
VELENVRFLAGGWHERFADSYPDVVGEGHTGLYAENSEGWEVEGVVEPRPGESRSIRTVTGRVPRTRTIIALSARDGWRRPTSHRCRA